ncbi:MAG: hypothetical protein QF921_10130 [Pseudomonadales bacterium]|jgi:hypothetical protein|nr:hypothetical protein [Pseudomonadales bacterium]MDP6473104.1 hypothetical protein [Pseudomonadales bacterium]MDP6826139.1 hypothetical protein [Pseudomonadales bacterium]MDP6971852.1 hypothetical protein [Pseudomonadales bacterium]|tara:strand:+ start:323 stop:784 length:462 start_codon:yes stop_codon:yes gene_type:complete
MLLLLLILTLATAGAYLLLWRTLWFQHSASNAGGFRAALIATLVGLCALVLSGRMPWSIALLIGILPFLRPFAQRFSANTQSDGERARPSASTGMSVPEALALLGLDEHAGERAVIDAHRRLMHKLHPDRGGTTYLAQQLNEAKHVLLKAFRT